MKSRKRTVGAKKHSPSEKQTHFSNSAELDAYLFPGKKRFRHRVMGGKIGTEVAKERLTELHKSLVSE